MTAFTYSLHSALDMRDDIKTYLLIRRPVNSTAQQCALLAHGSVVDSVKHKTRANPDYYNWESAETLRHFLYTPSVSLDTWTVGGVL